MKIEKLKGYTLNGNAKYRVLLSETKIILPVRNKKLKTKRAIRNGYLYFCNIGDPKAWVEWFTEQCNTADPKFISYTE